MVELDVDVVVLRSPEVNLCEDAAFREFIEEEIMMNYESPDFEGEDIRCQIQGLTLASCRTRSKPTNFNTTAKLHVG